MRKYKFDIKQIIPVPRKAYLSRLEAISPIVGKITKKDMDGIEKVQYPVLFFCLVKTTVLEGVQVIREFTGIAPLNHQMANGDELTIESFFQVDSFAGFEVENKTLAGGQLWDSFLKNQESARLSNNKKELQTFKNFVEEKIVENEIKKLKK